jgi:hypothetical protein
LSGPERRAPVSGHDRERHLREDAVIAEVEARVASLAGP